MLTKREKKKIPHILTQGKLENQLTAINNRQCGWNLLFIGLKHFTGKCDGEYINMYENDENCEMA